jgi:hypothetical protein
MVFLPWQAQARFYFTEQHKHKHKHKVKRNWLPLARFYFYIGKIAF